MRIDNEAIEQTGNGMVTSGIACDNNGDGPRCERCRALLDNCRCHRCRCGEFLGECECDPSLMSLGQLVDSIDVVAADMQRTLDGRRR